MVDGHREVRNGVPALAVASQAGKCGGRECDI